MEARAILGLKERLISPELVNDALDNYNAENDRLNKQHHNNAQVWQIELEAINQKIRQIVEAITDGMYHASMKERMDQLETRKAELTALLSNVPTDMPAIAPNVAEVYSQQIASLTKALSNKPERQVATQQLRQLIEKIVL